VFYTTVLFGGGGGGEVGKGDKRKNVKGKGR
jgi:hypothetical protein